MTEPFLEQGQIDQLIEAIDHGKVPTQPDALLSARNAHLLDLSDPTWSQDRVIRRPLPVLNLVFGRLGPSVQVTLTKSLRSPVRVEGTSLELQKFGEFRRQLGDARTLFEMIRLDPLAGISMLVMAPTITYSLIDALMGGLGIAEIPEGREISDIEIGLLSQVHEDVKKADRSREPRHPWPARVAARKVPEVSYRRRHQPADIPPDGRQPTPSLRRRLSLRPHLALKSQIAGTAQVLQHPAQ